jgi:hypothetical protein
MNATNFDLNLNGGESNFMSDFFDGPLDIMGSQWVGDGKTGFEAAPQELGKIEEQTFSDKNKETEHTKEGSPQEEKQNESEEKAKESAAKDSSKKAKPGSKKRTRANQEQLAVLEEVFANNTSPNSKFREALAAKLGMSERSIQIWFQNRRAKSKLLQRRRSQMHEDAMRAQSMYGMMSQGVALGSGMYPIMMMADMGLKGPMMMRHSISGPSADLGQLGRSTDGTL